MQALLGRNKGELRRWRNVALGMMVMSWCGTALAAPAGSRFAVDVFRTVQGLPSSVVFSVLQTRDGYLWLGTLEGLARFDGVEFTVYDPNNTPGLNSSQIVGLFEDSKANLWVATENSVALVANGKIREIDVGRVRNTSASGQSLICEDRTGAVWLYNDRGELCRYKDGSGNVWRADSGDSSIFRGLVADHLGLLWVGAHTELVALGPVENISGQKGSVLPVAQSPTNSFGQIDLVIGSKSGGCWVLADFRVQKWRGNERILDWPYAWAKNVVPVAACEDQAGNLVVGTYGDGVYWFDDAGKAARISGAEGLSHGSVLSVTVDREGCLWVGTNGGGLNRVKRRVFDVVAATRDRTVQSVCEDAQGAIWIGYNGERVDRWTGEQTEQFGLVVSDRSVSYFVKSVFVDRGGLVLAGTLNLRGGHLFQFQSNAFHELSSGSRANSDVSAMYQDRKGVLWVGTQSGLARWDEKRSVLVKEPKVSANAVRAIAEAADGWIWIGTDGGGVIGFREDNSLTFTKTNGLPSDQIFSLYADAEGVLWAGTPSGLARFHAGRWRVYSKKDGLISNSVGYIVEDEHGYLWIGSSAGLMRIKKKALEEFNEQEDADGTLACRIYGEADGLPANDCTFGSQPGAIRTKSGKLLFPTITGLAALNPTQLTPNTNPPPVIIEAVRVDGQLQNTNGLRGASLEKLTIPAGKESLDIRYTSLNLSAPDKGRFKYRLENYEKGWREASWNIRVAHYTKVPHGRYRFQVIAANEDDVWNEAGASLAIVVLPPFWQTWWFLAAATLTLLGMVVGSVHWVSTQKLQRQVESLRQQEALEHERARIARDLHDQLGANLTQVALLGEMAETDKDHPHEVEAHARQISQTARDTTRALDEIVWTVNPLNDTLDGVVNYVCKYAQEYLAIAGLRYRLDVPAQLPAIPISPELRHNVFLATKEAVNNVVKHAQASAVWLRLRLEPSRFLLEVEDDGKGLPEADAKSTRSGMRNMRKRMEDVGGEFTVTKGAEGGTLVRLTVPLEKSA